MKVHSNNYINTFIEIAEDCPVEVAEIPPLKEENKSIARMQYEIVSRHPYEYTSDDLLFHINAVRKDVATSELKEAREQFFSKGQACLRSSPLGKRYGWGIHHNEKGQIALYKAESKEYKNFVKDQSVKKVKAMKLKR